MNIKNRLTQISKQIAAMCVLFGLTLSVQSAQFFDPDKPVNDFLDTVDAIPLSQDFYYDIGGALPLPFGPGKNQAKFNLFGPGQFISGGLGCNLFSGGVSVENLINGVTKGVRDIMGLAQAALTSAIGAFPLYILQRADPHLYNLINQALNLAKADFSVMVDSCEKLEQQIAAGDDDPFADMIRIKRGDQVRSLFRGGKAPEDDTDLIKEFRASGEAMAEGQALCPCDKAFGNGGCVKGASSNGASAINFMAAAFDCLTDVVELPLEGLATLNELAEKDGKTVEKYIIDWVGEVQYAEQEVKQVQPSKPVTAIVSELADDCGQHIIEVIYADNNGPATQEESFQVSNCTNDIPSGNGGTLPLQLGPAAATQDTNRLTGVMIAPALIDEMRRQPPQNKAAVAANLASMLGTIKAVKASMEVKQALYLALNQPGVKTNPVYKDLIRDQIAEIDSKVGDMMLLLDLSTRFSNNLAKFKAQVDRDNLSATFVPGTAGPSTIEFRDGALVPIEQPQQNPGTNPGLF